MQKSIRRLDSSTVTIISDLELLTPSRRALKSKSKSESEHEYIFSSDDTQDTSIDTLKNNIPESVSPPWVIMSPGIEISEGVQPHIIFRSENDKPGDMEAQLIRILQNNNIQDNSPIYISVQTVPSTEVASNIGNATSFGVIIAIMIGIIVFLLTKTFNWYFNYLTKEETKLKKKVMKDIEQLL